MTIRISMTHKILNFLPGPVEVSDKVAQAFSTVPISHRSPEFRDMLESIQEKLSEMTGARGAQVLMGSGTLANDAVGAQLSLIEGQGLIVTNGEFGERLLDHAKRFSLDFESFKYSWGEPLDYVEISEAVKNNPGIKWIWAVHSETSTGVLNDIDRLKTVCAEYGPQLAVDCISSIGTVPVDLRGVYIATGVSGKGLASYPGLSMVFHNSDILPTRRDIPRYLDLYQYSRSETVPYTVSSNLVSALKSALDTIDYEKRFKKISELSTSLRKLLEESGFSVLSESGYTSPSIVTVPLPEYISSCEFGKALEQQGFYIHHRSGYLESRNWVQIALMGECEEQYLESLVVHMESYLMQNKNRDAETTASLK